MYKYLTMKNLEVLTTSFLTPQMVKESFANNPYATYLVYLEDNKVIGYIYYSAIYERVEINQFEVLKTKRNTGIGTKLLEKLLQDVPKDITLEVRVNNAPAIHLYEKLGFEKVALRKGYYQGIDGILMEHHHE
jgi:[ribosomal protein S18]-alanine N-acetyltransferase